MKCRHCNTDLQLSLIDLGSAPPSNAYLTLAKLREPEKWFPLRVLVCTKCWLVQTEDFVGADELFSKEYAYFSSFSVSWLEHARNYVETMTRSLSLSDHSMVVEIAANDGYLLQYVKEKNIPCYGIEPTGSTAEAARKKGIAIIERFFGTKLADELARAGKQADLIAANNVLAHVPDINDFVKGFSILLKPGGVATFEFPHLYSLVKQNQFDTIYHEHYSYISLTAVHSIFEANGLTIFDVEKLPTHGGSLRVHTQRSDTGCQPASSSVDALLKQESLAGMRSKKFYQGFQKKAEKIKTDFLSFLIEAKRKGKTVVGYGAAAKGNTLMNFAGIKPDLVSYIVDRNPSKQGKYMPGSHIPIKQEKCLQLDKPDYVLILPWNLQYEVRKQLAYTWQWNCRFVTAIPELHISSV